MVNRTNRDAVLLVLIILAFGAYSLPWLVNPSVGLTLGAYDLAEWSTLHPEVRNDSPELLLSLLLRVPLVGLAVIAAFSSSLRRVYSITWWLIVISIALLLTISFPPLEFVTEARNDLNYLQQFFLTMIGGVLVLWGISGIASQGRPYIVLVVALIAAGMSVVGMLQARHFLIGFSMPVSVGLGGVLFVVSLAFITAFNFASRG